MEAAPVSLYIDLEDGQKADLEVVARASIAFAAAVKELAFILDPSLDIRIELASGTEGSLSLNSVIRAVKKHTGLDERLTVAAVAVGVLIWFGEHLADWSFHKVMDYLTGETAVTETLSPEQIEQLADKISEMIEKKVAHPQVQEVYRELERDHAVKGVGASSVPGARPKRVVPRAEFPQRAGHFQIKETTSIKRETTKQERVTLISPVLIQGARKWRFRSALGEFAASIKDDVFVERLLSGRILVPMTGGIEMEVLLRITEEQEKGVWVITDRSIVQVLDIHPTAGQPGLDFSPRQ
jgi:hypothetical protein